MKSLCEFKKLKAIIKLLEKPNIDKRYVANWRPISLLNFDLKILSKSLATRLKNVLGHGGTDCYEKCAAAARSCCHSSVLASAKIFKWDAG